MSDAPAYFAPAFRIKVAGKALDPAQEQAVAELAVTHELGTSDYFSVVLTSPYPDLPWTNGEDADLFVPGVGVTIEMGYVDDTQLLMTGEVTGLAANFPSDGASTLRVDGHSRLHRLDGPRRSQTFVDVSDSQIAEKVAQQAGLSCTADTTQLKHPYVIQNNQTDLEFLRERADGIHFELLADEQGLAFRKPKTGASASLKLKWGESLQRFQPTLNALAPVTDVTVRGYDVKAKAGMLGRAAPGDEETTMGGRSGAKLVETAFGSRAEIIADRQPASQAEAESRAKAIFNQRAMALITGDGVSIGNPALRAGTVVAIEGLGETFSGSYYVVRSTHAMNSSGYETQFSVRRNATS